MQALFFYKDEEVHDVQWNAFRGIAKVCRDCELVKEEMPVLTREAIVRTWQQVLEDVQASNVYTKNLMWRSTDVLRQVVSEKE